MSGSAFAETSPVMVELFTSQGCSSCPAADRLAGLMMAQPGIMVVSLNVDYWDYLGWKDTLAKPEYTKRQMDYAHARGDMDVYTPQMVINGTAHAVGSNQSSIESAIAKARRQSPLANLVVNVRPKSVDVTMPAKLSGAATLWLMALAPKVNVKIERGENSGKSITYNNVVLQLSKLSTWNGTDQQITLSRSGPLAGTVQNSIVLLQRENAGSIIGLAKLT